MDRSRPGAATLELDRLVKRWPDAPPVLDGVSLSLRRGTAISIAGRNGAGKTTLLRVASGLIAPESGSVRLCGLDPERDRCAFQRRTGFLSAGNSGLYARLTAAQHLELWARLALLPRTDRAPAIARVREQFALDALVDKRVDRLSMGQRQRLRLAMAFLHDPTVVLLDEPVTSLDEEGIALVEASIDGLKARGGSAIVCLPSGWEQLPSIDESFTLANGQLERA